MTQPVPKPPPREQAPRKPLRATKWGVSDKPRTAMKKQGETKRKKVDRQQAFYASATWRQMKKDAKTRAGHRCEYLMSNDVDYSLRRPWRLMDLEQDQWFNDAGVIRCAETQKLHVHHKTNIRFGGDERPEDLQCLCSYHHGLVEARDFPHRRRHSQFPTS